jgi:orotate phosphoribosyltransferase
VKNHVVLIQRGPRGREELARRGVNLHACFTVDAFITECREMNMISEEEHRHIMEFLQK